MRRTLILAVALAACFTLAGCVVYRLPGISMKAGAADPQLQELARRALRHQDPYAQLELGTRYEYGRGVPVNWKFAEGFYEAASRSWGGGTWNMGAGGALSFMAGGRRKGLPEAKSRLEALRARKAASARRSR